MNWKDKVVVVRWLAETLTPEQFAPLLNLPLRWVLGILGTSPPDENLDKPVIYRGINGKVLHTVESSIGTLYCVYRYGPLNNLVGLVHQSQVTFI